MQGLICQCQNDSLSTRRQFGIPNQPENLLIDYTTHMRRLFPRIAEVYALSFYCTYCKNRYEKRTPGDVKEIHILVAGSDIVSGRLISLALKIYSSWQTSEGLQVCR